MNFRVRTLERAQADADEIYLWLRKRSPAGALAWFVALTRKLDELTEFAINCSPAPEAIKLGIDLRQAFFKTRRGRTYRMLFVIIGNEVVVLRVRGPRQRLVTRRDLPSIHDK